MEHGVETSGTRQRLYSSMAWMSLLAMLDCSLAWSQSAPRSSTPQTLPNQTLPASLPGSVWIDAAGQPHQLAPLSSQTHWPASQVRSLSPPSATTLRHSVQALLSSDSELIDDSLLLDGSQLLPTQGDSAQGDSAQGDSAQGNWAQGNLLIDGGGLQSDAAAVLNSLGPSAPNVSADHGPLGVAPHSLDSPSRGGVPAGLDPHAEAFANDLYPSATKCAPCHQKIYDEWRVSAHAYAAISPMFHKFEQKITELSQGTVGTFCLRCHAPAAVQLDFPRYASIVDAPLVFREGVTCVACHRVKEAYGRVHGERRIEPGPLAAPIYGTIGGDGVARAIADKENYKIKIDPNDQRPSQQIHLQGIQFEQLNDSAYCQACHQVAVHPGINLEVVWAQYRAGPACKKGISCQDCHMGMVPGKPLGYEVAAAANMSGKTVNDQRKHSNHMFFGPGNSIAHPGIFPHNEKSLRWTVDQWMHFDWRSGWGTEDFERALADRQIAASFPPDWTSADDRRDARKVLDENLKLLAIKKASSIAVMEAGMHVAGPFFERTPQRGQDLLLHYQVHNVSEGHNSPSGSLGAQPQLWLNVVLTGPSGLRLWESGYLDANGDLANQHSLLVTQRLIPPDRQLFNLQTQFITTGVKGPDREMYLPVNVDIDQLPFLRPGNIPYTVLNHPPFIRMEQKSIPPLGNKVAGYHIPGELLTQCGTYRLSARMRSRMEPIYFMRFCEATPEMERRMLEQTIDLHPYSVEFTVR